MIGDYNSIFKVLSERISLKYLDNKDSWVAELSGLVVDINNDLRAMHLVFKDLSNHSFRRKFDMHQFNSIIYQDTSSGNFKRYSLGYRLVLIVDDRYVLA